jgi:patatin-related protein
MAFDKPSPVTELTQELRLATTMTGGVSLAIWMAGVAREINLLAQASQWRRRGGSFPADTQLPKESAACLRLYAELIDLLDTVVDVDVLSGTSAGGISATLLASSRVTGADLGGLRDLWLDLGALTDLLRDPKDKNAPSLLYGDECMFAKLSDEIPKLATGPFPPSKGDRLPSTTLYVTTTLLSGETSRFTDSYGTPVQDVDRRGIFTFTEADLATSDNASALALAARCSASFPLAFEPSFVPFTDKTVKKGDVLARPAMARFANITRPHWVADGGLLDNQPIDVLLKRIFDQPAQRAVRRVLLFVVPSAGPSPDLAEEAPPDDASEPLGLVDGLLKELAAVTTQSIAADLRAFRTHQDRMEARTDAKLRLAELAAKLGNYSRYSRLLTPSLLADYVKREATKHAQELTSALLRQLSTWPPASSNSTKSVPAQWEADLAIGDNAEMVCRRAIKRAIRSSWTQPLDFFLPAAPASFARFGQPAYDLAKACALAIVQTAYQLARTDDDFIRLAKLTENIHNASDPPDPIDLGKLVCAVCTNNDVRKGSLENAATALAHDYLDCCEAQAEAWQKLAQAMVDGYEGILKPLTDHASSASNSKDHVADLPLTKYLTYLRPGNGNNPRRMAEKLFDLALTQRAMLPAEADIEQSLELVQVSADTRSLLAPDWQTAQQKLTGMQLHHFGAFYKRSWRANDWMWGRLDGAGWLVHVLLDPRRVHWIVQDRVHGANSGARWFLGKLKDIGALNLPDLDEASSAVTEDMLLKELAFLDDSSMAIPPSIPMTALWLAQKWQRRVLDDELDKLANTVIDPQPGKKPDWSPSKSRSWAEQVLDTKGNAKYKLLNANPVASETFASDKGSPLMAHTITKAAATASAAVGSIRQMPAVLKPPLLTLRTVALGGYRVVSLTKGIVAAVIAFGVALLVVGVAAAIQSTPGIGAAGLVMAGIGGYVIVFGTWQLSSRTFFALLAFTLVGAVLSLATPVERRWLFGSEKNPGWIGTHVYWLGSQWWHPLLVVVAIALSVTLLAAAKPGRKR